MKHLALVTLATCFSSFVYSADQAEEYSYIEAPLATQVADLQDNDKDGVINARDKCTTTPLGSAVDNYGCEKYIESSQTKQLKILFANDSYEINPVFMSQIRIMAQFLEQYSTASIELQGYASKTGNAEHNLTLSKNRAKAVRSALISYGVAPSRVKIVGFGDAVLVNQDTTMVAHALNRRVVASVVGYTGDVEKEWTIFTRRNR